MKTILVLASHPELAESLRVALDPERYRIVHRLNSDEAEPLLQHALLQVCVVDAELAETQGVWLFEKLRRRLPIAPIIVFTNEGKWALEEEAYLAGVKHVLTKPVRARMLEAVLEQPVQSAAWKHIASTYLVCAKDQGTPADRQREFARRAGSVVELDAGHHPFLSQPAAVRDLVLGL